MTRETEFETVYHNYPFAPLVELALTIGQWLKNAMPGGYHARHTDTGIGHAA